MLVMRGGASIWQSELDDAHGQAGRLVYRSDRRLRLAEAADRRSLGAKTGFRHPVLPVAVLRRQADSIAAQAFLWTLLP